MKPVKPIRLFWGENYAEKPAIVKQALERAGKNSINTVHLYPGELYQEVVELISQTLHVQPEQIVLGHGIEGLIHTTTLSFLDQSKTGGMFDPSFFVFKNNLDRYPHVYYPCRYDQTVDVKDLIAKIQRTDLFFLASPNTATGNYLLDQSQIERLLREYLGLLVVDECYFGIGDQTVIDLIRRYNNLMIYRGVTKVMGLAGTRLGFAVSNANVIKKLNYHFTDIELDPVNSFALNVFKEVFPYFNILVETTNKFFTDFLEFMQTHFLDDRFIKTFTTYYFMNITRYKTQRHEVINYMNDHGYLFSSTTLHECPKGKYPELIEITPPPQKYWEDFAQMLKKALR